VQGAGASRWAADVPVIEFREIFEHVHIPVVAKQRLDLTALCSEVVFAGDDFESVLRKIEVLKNREFAALGVDREVVDFMGRIVGAKEIVQRDGGDGVRDSVRPRFAVQISVGELSDGGQFRGRRFEEIELGASLGPDTASIDGTGSIPRQICVPSTSGFGEDAGPAILVLEESSIRQGYAISCAELDEEPMCLEVQMGENEEVLSKL